MAVTASNALSIPYRIVGHRKETVYDVTFDSSYLEKGETLKPATVGLNYGESALCQIKEVKGTVNVASAFYNPEKALIHLYDETPAEVASEANVEGVIVQVTTRGH